MRKIVIVPLSVLSVYKRILSLLFTIILGVHRKTTKPLHVYLIRKNPLYHRVWQWRQLRRVRIPAGIATTLLVVVFVLSQFHNVFAIGTWTQGDWSGGVGSSTVNQYSASTNTVTSTASQITLSGKANWYNSAWKHRKQITIDHTKVAANQTNFPILIKESSDADLVASAQSSGNDIAFTDSNGTTKLASQTESYNSTTGALVAWVKLPALSSTTDTTLYMYYGDATAVAQQDPTSVWDSNYAGVWHLNSNGATLSTNDSTSNARNGTNNGVTATSGEIDGGGHFLGNGTTYIDAGNNPITGSSPFTLSAWVNTAQVSSYSGALSIGAPSSTNAAYIGTIAAAQVGGANSLGGGFFGMNIGTGVSTLNQWSYLTLSFSGGSNGTATFYVNGVAKTTTTYTPSLAADHIQIGRIAGSPSYDFSGSIDEARLSSSSRSASWIATNYSNQSSPATFESLALQESNFQTSASLTSNIYDTGLAQNWATLSYTDSTPSGTSVSVRVRTGNNADLSDASSWSSCSAIASGSDITSTCAPDKTRYVQYQISLTGDSSSTPVFSNISLGYTASDNVPPPTNASNLKLYKSDGGIQLSSNNWTSAYPYLTWSAGADDSGGSGILGYCLYLGHDPTGNPITTKGFLGVSPVDTGGTCQFAVSSTSVDLSLSGYIGTALSSSATPYYLNVVAIDKADNVYNATSPAQFQFRFDNTPPSNPTFVSAPSEFVSSKQVTITWPTTGSDAPSDADSGVAGLQYRIGSSGTWYGANHNGNQDSSDLLNNDGSYTTLSSPDYANLNDGNNLVYFRTWDNAGNVSAAYVTTVIKINTTAPSTPQNLTATPSINTTNSFAFSWLPPSTYIGSASNITYCYTVNVLPTSNSCTFTNPGVTSLSTGAYATAPGANTMYIVAKDESGVVNYATAASVTFTANTPAPGVPLNLDIADVSIKSTSSWKLALSWNPPSVVGAGIATYKVLRSTDNYNFSNVASTAGTSYVDSGLGQQLYYYEVEACDSANNCGIHTGVVNLLPTGKYTSAANLLVSPSSAPVGTRSATIIWVTDRNSNSSIEYGLSSNNYFSSSVSNNDQVASHSVTLNNLQAGTTYYYRAQWADGDGNTGTSGEATFTTLPAPKVSNVSETGTNITQTTISFTSTNAASVGLIYRGGSLNDTRLLNTSTSTSTYSIPLKGLSPGTTYSFTLNPTDSTGNLYTNISNYSFSTPPAPAISNVAFEPMPGALTGTEQVSWTTNVPTNSQISYGQQGHAATSGTEAIDTSLTTTHTMTISNLSYNTPYWLMATSQDILGNVTVSDQQIFHTGLDTRPPTVSQVTIQPSIKGSGVDAQGQIIVSWKTDKPGSSQVEYGQGTGSGYNAKTAEDTSMVLNHVVVISDLPPSYVYHLQALSRDDAGNIGKSPDRTTIIGQATDSVINIIFNALQGIFGGL